MRGGVRGRAAPHLDRVTNHASSRPDPEDGRPAACHAHHDRHDHNDRQPAGGRVRIVHPSPWATLGRRRPNRIPPEGDFAFRGRPGQSNWVEPVYGGAPRSSTWDLTTSEDRVGRGVIPGRRIPDRSVGRA